MNDEPEMTAAPTPRDGEREHYESHKDLYDVADDCVMLVPDSIKLSVTMWRRAVRPIVEKLAAHVAQRVAEAVGPLEAKLHAINLAVDGYVDGAPDAGPVAKLANEVSCIINQP